MDFEKRKENLVLLLQRDISKNKDLDAKIIELTKELEKQLPQTKVDSRVKNLKDKFFAIDEKINSGNWKKMKEEKKKILHKIILEERTKETYIKEKISSLKSDPRFVYLITLEGKKNLSYSSYKELRGMTCTYHKFSDLKGIPKDNEKVKKLMKLCEENGSKQAPSSNRVIYMTYFNIKHNGKTYEYLCPGVANEISLQKTWRTIFPSHIGRSLAFINENNLSASLMERMLAVFGPESCATFIIDTEDYPEGYVKYDPIFKKYKQYAEKEFGDLKKTSLGLLD